MPLTGDNPLFDALDILAGPRALPEGTGRANDANDLLAGLDHAMQVRVPQPDQYPVLVPPDIGKQTFRGFGHYSYPDRTVEEMQELVDRDLADDEFPDGPRLLWDEEAMRDDWQARLHQHLMGEEILSFQEFSARFGDKLKPLGPGEGRERTLLRAYGFYQESVSGSLRGVADRLGVTPPEDIPVQTPIPDQDEVEKTWWFRRAHPKDQEEIRGMYSRIKQWERRLLHLSPDERPGPRLKSAEQARRALVEQLDELKGTVGPDGEVSLREMERKMAQNQMFIAQNMVPMDDRSLKLWEWASEHPEERGPQPQEFEVVANLATEFVLQNQDHIGVSSPERAWAWAVEYDEGVLNHPALREAFMSQYRYLWENRGLYNDAEYMAMQYAFDLHDIRLPGYRPRTDEARRIERMVRGLDEEEKGFFLWAFNRHLDQHIESEHHWSFLNKLGLALRMGIDDIQRSVETVPHWFGLTGARAEASWKVEREMANIVESHAPKGDGYFEMSFLRLARTSPAWMAAIATSTLTAGASSAALAYLTKKKALIAKGAHLGGRIGSLTFWTGHIGSGLYGQFRTDFGLDRTTAGVMAGAFGFAMALIEDLQIVKAFGQPGVPSEVAAQQVGSSVKKALLGFLREKGKAYVHENAIEVYQEAIGFVARAVAAHTNPDVDFEWGDELEAFRQTVISIPVVMGGLTGMGAVQQASTIPAAVRANRAHEAYNSVYRMMLKEQQAMGKPPHDRGLFEIPPPGQLDTMSEAELRVLAWPLGLSEDLSVENLRRALTHERELLAGVFEFEKEGVQQLSDEELTHFARLMGVDESQPREVIERQLAERELAEYKAETGVLEQRPMAELEVLGRTTPFYGTMDFLSPFGERTTLDDLPAEADRTQEDFRGLLNWEALEDFVLAFPREAHALSQLDAPSRREYQTWAGADAVGSAENRALIAAALRLPYFQQMIGAPTAEASEAMEQRTEAEQRAGMIPEAYSEWVRTAAEEDSAWAQKELAVLEGRPYMPWAERLERLQRHRETARRAWMDLDLMTPERLPSPEQVEARLQAERTRDGELRRDRMRELLQRKDRRGEMIPPQLLEHFRGEEWADRLLPDERGEVAEPIPLPDVQSDELVDRYDPGRLPGEDFDMEGGPVAQIDAPLVVPLDGVDYRVFVDQDSSLFYREPGEYRWTPDERDQQMADRLREELDTLQAFRRLTVARERGLGTPESPVHIEAHGGPIDAYIDADGQVFSRMVGEAEYHAADDSESVALRLLMQDVLSAEAIGDQAIFDYEAQVAQETQDMRQESPVRRLAKLFHLNPDAMPTEEFGLHEVLLDLHLLALYDTPVQDHVRLEVRDYISRKGYRQGLEQMITKLFGQENIVETTVQHPTFWSMEIQATEKMDSRYIVSTIDALTRMQRALGEHHRDINATVEALEGDLRGAPTDSEAATTDQKQVEFEPPDQGPVEIERIAELPFTDIRTDNAEVLRQLEERAEQPADYTVEWNHLLSPQRQLLRRLVRNVPEILIDPHLVVVEVDGQKMLGFHDKIQLLFNLRDFRVVDDLVSVGDRVRVPVEKIRLTRKTARERVLSGDYTPTRKPKPPSPRTTPKRVPGKRTARVLGRVDGFMRTIKRLIDRETRPRFATDKAKVEANHVIVGDGRHLTRVAKENAPQFFGVEADTLVNPDGEPAEGTYPNYERHFQDIDTDNPLTEFSGEALETFWRDLHTAAEFLKRSDKNQAALILNRDGTIGLQARHMDGRRGSWHVSDDSIMIGEINPALLAEMLEVHYRLGMESLRFWWPGGGKPLAVFDNVGNESIQAPMQDEKGQPLGLNRQQIDLWLAGQDPHAEDGPDGSQGERGERTTDAPQHARAVPGDLTQIGNSRAEAQKQQSRSGDVAPEAEQQTVEQISENINTEEARGAIRTFLDGALEMFMPTARGPIAKLGARVLRKQFAEQARKMAVAQKQIWDLRRNFWRMPREEIVNFMDRMEKGEGQPTAELQHVAESLRELLDRMESELADRELLDQFIENYFPHVWADNENAQRTLARMAGRRPFAGPREFQHARTIMRISEGIKQGLVPASWNPIDMVLLKAQEIERCIMAHRTKEEMLDRGMMQFVYARSRMPAGWARINDGFFTVHMAPHITVKEAYDKTLFDNMLGFLARLGVSHDRVATMRGKAWGVARGEREVVTRFASPVQVLIHEVGHIIANKYDLFEWMTRKGDKSPEAVELRRTIVPEMRALADARAEDIDTVSESHRRYLRQEAEKEAVILEALLYAPERMEEVAPTVMRRMQKFLRDHQELAPLLEMKRDLVLAEAETDIEVPGLTTLGYYAAPQEVATLFNNHLSPGLWNSPNQAIRLGYEGLRMAGNVINQMNLAFSAFHGLFTAFTTITNQMAVGLRETFDWGRWDMKIPGIYKVATAPLAPITSLLRGHRLRKAYRTSLEQIQDPQMRAMVEALVVAGGRTEMPTHYYNQGIGAFARSLEQVVKGPMKEKARGMATALPNLVTAGLEVASKLLLFYYVPMTKIGAFQMMATHEMQRLKHDTTNPDFSDERLVWAMNHVWDRVDDRFGQLVYDNLFWNRVWRDFSMLAVRSVGWNWGSLREYSGAFKDIADTHGRLESGDAWMSHRIAHLIAEVLFFGTAGAVTQMLMSGKRPEEPKDYFYPQTGRLNPDGTWERIIWPGYHKDWYGWTTQPWTTARNKLHPLATMLAYSVQNEDFFGTEIRHPGDPMFDQVKDLLEFGAEQMLPFSVRNVQRLKDTGRKPETSWLMGMAGVLPAPQYVVQTDAQRLMTSYIVDRLPRGTRTKEQYEQSRERRVLTQQLRDGEPVDWEELREQWTGQELGRIIQAASDPHIVNMYKRLTFAEALNVYARGTNEEQGLWRDILIDKYRRADRADPDFPDKQRMFAELMGEKYDIDDPVSTDEELMRSHEEYISRQAWALARPRPVPRRGESRSDFQRRVRQWDEQTGRAMFALESMGIDSTEALTALTRYARGRRMDLGSDAFAARRAHLRRRMRGLGESTP